MFTTRPQLGLLQVWDGCLHRPQVADDLFKVVQDVGVTDGLNGAGRATDAGRVVDHDVDAAELARRCGDEVLDRVCVRGITNDRDDFAPIRAPAP